MKNNQIFSLKKILSHFKLINQPSEKSGGSFLLTAKFVTVFFVILLVFAESPWAVKKTKDDAYIDMGNQVIRDTKLNKMWTKTGSYFELKKWLHWEKSKQFAKRKNQVRFGDFNDWRLPTRKELKSLYNRGLKGQWSYEKSERIYTTSHFNLAYCYFWTSERFDDELVWQVSLCNGRAYKTGPDNYPGNSVLLIRP